MDPQPLVQPQAFAEAGALSISTGALSDPAFLPAVGSSPSPIPPGGAAGRPSLPGRLSPSGRLSPGPLVASPPLLTHHLSTGNFPPASSGRNRPVFLHQRTDTCTFTSCFLKAVDSPRVSEGLKQSLGRIGPQYKLWTNECIVLIAQATPAGQYPSRMQDVQMMLQGPDSGRAVVLRSVGPD